MIFKIIVAIPVLLMLAFAMMYEGREILKKRDLSEKEENYIFYLQLWVMISMLIIFVLLSII